MPMHEELLKVRQVADELQWSTKSVYKRIKDGSLRAYRLYGEWRIPRSAINEMLRGESK